MKENNIVQTVLTEGSYKGLRLYLAYGSNLNPERMKERCPNARKVGTTFMENNKLVFRKSATGFYLSFERAIGHKVPVGVFLLAEGEEKRLDRCEGYPVYYRKKRFCIPLIGGGWVEAFAYYLPTSFPKGVPTREYVSCVKVGYRHFGFDLKYLSEALDEVEPLIGGMMLRD